MKTLVYAFVLSLLCGCASFVTDQKDITYDPKTGNKTREIATSAKSRTVVASKSSLGHWKASQTDKTQGAAVGNLSQETDGASFMKELRGLINDLKPPTSP